MIVTPMGTARFVTAYGIPEDIGRDALAGNVRLWLVYTRYTIGLARFVTAYGIPEDIGRDAPAGSTRLWLVYDRYTNGYRPVRYCLQAV